MRKLRYWFEIEDLMRFGIEIRVYEGFWDWVLREEEFGI